jgi:hypothetical protein
MLLQLLLTNNWEASGLQGSAFSTSDLLWAAVGM